MAHFVLQTALVVWREISSRAKGFSLTFMMVFSVLSGAQADGISVTTDWRGGIPAENVLAYEITRKDKRLGFQIIEFSEAEDGSLIADIHIEIDFKLGFIPLFRYRHDSREIWRDGRLMALTSRTDNNGEDVSVALRRENGVLVGRGSRYQADLQDVTHSTSYFDPNFIRQTSFVSSQDGRRFATEIEEIGRETLNLQIGPVEATRFRTSGKFEIDIWYTDAGRWVKTEFTRGGNTLVISAVNPTSVPLRRNWERP